MGLVGRRPLGRRARFRLGGQLLGALARGDVLGDVHEPGMARRAGPQRPHDHLKPPLPLQSIAVLEADRLPGLRAGPVVAQPLVDRRARGPQGGGASVGGGPRRHPEERAGRAVVAQVHDVVVVGQLDDPHHGGRQLERFDRRIARARHLADLPPEHARQLGAIRWAQLAGHHQHAQIDQGGEGDRRQPGDLAAARQEVRRPPARQPRRRRRAPRWRPAATRPGGRARK